MAQAISTSRASWMALLRWIALALVLLVVGVAFAFQSQWWPEAQARLAAISGKSSPPAASHDEHEAGHEGHDHAGHSETNSLELSAQARKNIGLKVGQVELTTFTRSVTIPGIVVERPGRSLVKVTTPMTGIVTKIYPIEGESAEPGEPLFELRLTHEEIVQAQADLLRTAEELDVVAREIVRMEKVTADGAIAGKALLERKYEQQKLQAVNRSQQQALLLHGLTTQQVESILKDRSLLQKVTIEAPPITMSMAAEAKYQIQSVVVSPGQHVNAGDPLATLIDYSTLLIEGNAFEADASLIARAAQQKEPVVAVVDREGQPGERIQGLRILYQGSRIDPDTRAMHFYVILPNEVHETRDGDEQRSFLTWKYRPGQRMRLRVPAETWAERIVLPVDAIALDGIETYVFVPNGDHFDRRPVHVEYRDDASVVIENDGALFPGEAVAINGAQQLQLALKNKSGGAIDPHAGHNH
jgi:multidrug efflux pump subunit AcrA (membrane-fusion protein)